MSWTNLNLLGIQRKYLVILLLTSSATAQATREKQFCPFLDDECKKPRKSQPEVKIGVCTVGYKGNFLKKITPVIVCPHRFRESIVYDTIKELYFGDLPDGYQIKWASEVSCGVAGSIDFVATKMKEGEIEDFLCVEFQAAGDDWNSLASSHRLQTDRGL